MFGFISFFVLTFLVTFAASDDSMPGIFFRTFANNGIFNVTKFDGIYPLIRHDWKKFNSFSQVDNVIDKCPIVKNLSEQWTKKDIDIRTTDGISIVNNYLYQKFLESPCANMVGKRRPTKFTVTEVWIYGLLTVTFINTFAVCGILFMPLVNKTFYNTLMTFMVSMAVGSLAGTAILILIPDSMKVSEMAIHGGFNKYDYKWKATVVFAGLYLFFLTERLFKTLILKKNKVHGEPRNEPANGSMALNSTDNHFSGDSIKPLEDNPKLSERNVVLNPLAKAGVRIDPVAWMIVFGDAMHNFVDGLSIGAAFSFDVMSGVSVSVAIMCEELPHELGDFAVLISSGMTFKEAIFWNTMSAMTCYLGFIIGVIVGEVTSASVWIFAIAGGMFLYISLVDMMNDIIAMLDDLQCSRAKKLTTFALQNLGLLTGYSIILIVSIFGDQIQFGG